MKEFILFFFKRILVFYGILGKNHVFGRLIYQSIKNTLLKSIYMDITEVLPSFLVD